ncbi:MAG: ribonuclease HII [SAR202 cluster bacterium]|nr:ribonuclease HII [SAR202 cluster bacterium]
MEVKITKPDYINEKQLAEFGYNFIAGIDEVGRGTLAGPVLSALVIFPKDFHSEWFSLIDDSKRLTENKRLHLFHLIKSNALSVSVGSVSNTEIDQIGISSATKLSMLRAIESSKIRPDYLLIDAVKLNSVDIAQKSIVKGDQISSSIAAASIIAKVTRDQIMVDFDKIYTKYGFGNHKGYGTKFHVDALNEYGMTPIHRKSFEPVKSMIKESK